MVLIRINIEPEDLYQYLNVNTYTHVRVYRSLTVDGEFTEITDSSTRILLYVGEIFYRYVVSDALPGQYWYKYSFGNNTSESILSDSFQNQLGDPTKIGYFFGNYSAPPGVFGKVMTHDDVKEGYLFGIDLIAQDMNYTAWNEKMTDKYMEMATKEFERNLNIDIYRRKYVSNPASTLRKASMWMNGVDYTDEENAYTFTPEEWNNFGFVQLLHKPVLNVTRATLVGPTQVSILNLISWERVNKNTGQLHFFPRNQMPFGPYLGGLGTILLFQGQRYPQALEIDYETGYESADKVPEDLRHIIGKYCALLLLNVIGDAILPGFSSQSVSLDGLSESFSSTQSATSAYFGARIKVYTDDIKEWLLKNRFKFGNGPAFGFVGAR
ncbi:MAG: hypothetical protein WC516_06510 [Patescibacteria group bacterium]|jgi:hypothetical protein